MALDLQASLLRVLQLKEITRIGGKRTIPVDVRIIAATNRDLEAKIRDNTFRSDLFYRLNVFPINLPTLRDRRDDIRLFVEHLIRNYRLDGFPVESIDAEALHALEQYSWPGNVRELHNAIERAVNIAQSKHITVAELPENIRENLRSNIPPLPPPAAEAQKPAPADAPLSLQGDLRKIKDTERDMISLALRRTAGNVSRASKLLGIGRKTMYYKMNIYGIDVCDIRSGV